MTPQPPHDHSLPDDVIDVASALDRVAHSDRAGADAGLEERVFAASRASLAGQPALRLDAHAAPPKVHVRANFWYRPLAAAASIAIAAGGIWLATAPRPTSNVVIGGNGGTNVATDDSVETFLAMVQSMDSGFQSDEVSRLVADSETLDLKGALDSTSVLNDLFDQGAS